MKKPIDFEQQRCLIVKKGALIMPPFPAYLFYSDLAGPCFGFTSGFVIF